MVSETGSSSGRVTSSTRQRAGSLRRSTTSWAWVRRGPPRAALTSPLAEVRNVMAWPVAGASTRIRSATPSRSSCLTLPRTSTSRMPGMAVETTSRIPECASRFGHALQAVVLEILHQRVVGREPPGPDRPVVPPVPAGPAGPPGTGGASRTSS